MRESQGGNPIGKALVSWIQLNEWPGLQLLLTDYFLKSRIIL